MKIQENNEVFKDLSCRLPYGVMIHSEGWNPEKLESIVEGRYNDEWFTTKPILRTISSMTKEEKMDLLVVSNGLVFYDNGTDTIRVHTYNFVKQKYEPDAFIYIIKVFDWLNKKHFDYRGLIEQDLAEKAPEQMYIHFGDIETVIVNIEHKDKL